MTTKIRLEEPFASAYKFGYIVTNKENRRHVILYNSDKDRSTISYARYLYSVHLGRFLTKDEQVDHINNDKTDDSLENLQILSVKSNNRKQANLKGYQIVNYICPVCTSAFMRRKGASNKVPSKMGELMACSKNCRRLFYKLNLTKQQKEELIEKSFINEERIFDRFTEV